MPHSTRLKYFGLWEQLLAHHDWTRVFSLQELSPSVFPLDRPDDNTPIHTARAELPHASTLARFKDANRVDGILMRGAQLGIVLDLAFQIHLTKQIESGLFLHGAAHAAALHLDTAHHLPSLGLGAAEAERFAVVAGGNDLSLAVPDQARERQDLRADVEHGTRRRVGPGRVHDGDGGVVAREGECVAGGTERHGVDPAGSIVEILATDSVERQSFTPHASLGPFIDTFDEAREHTRMAVG